MATPLAEARPATALRAGRRRRDRLARAVPSAPLFAHGSGGLRAGLPGGRMASFSRQKLYVEISIAVLFHTLAHRGSHRPAAARPWLAGAGWAQGSFRRGRWAAVSIQSVRKSYGKAHGHRTALARYRRRRVPGPRRSFGMREIHPPADDRRARGHHGTARSAFAGGVINDLAPKDRDIAMVFQSYALYPHMSVAREHELLASPEGAGSAGAGHPGECRGRKSSGSRPSCSALPRQLSGRAAATGWRWGRAHRARAAGLPLRRGRSRTSMPSSGCRMRSEIKLNHARLKTTTVYVTHDQIEAMTLADRIVVDERRADRARWETPLGPLRQAGQPLRRGVQSARQR